jgi:alkanesulfonate monooxygenase
LIFVLLAFLHDEDIEEFGKEVLPLVTKLEKEGRGKNVHEDIGKTGDICRAKKG